MVANAAEARDIEALILRFNALAGASTISGSIDWRLTGRNNWVRIQPDATLRKGGSNQITFGGGTVTNNGVLEVAQGTLRITSLYMGNGEVRIKGGTLAFLGASGLVFTGYYLSLAAGEALADDPRLPLVSATGSCRMGRALAPRVAARFGRTLLELGGNNAAIVAPSADLDLAERAIAFAHTYDAGVEVAQLFHNFARGAQIVVTESLDGHLGLRYRE